MIVRLGLWISDISRRVALDPFALAVALTAVAVAGGTALGRVGFLSLVDTWAGPSGVWGLHAFAMQMCLILVTGHALAHAPAVSRVLDAVAARLDGPVRAVAGVGLVAALLGVLNWGLGLIAGALLARRVGESMRRRGVAVHYPLLCAAGYMGLLVWHGGFSGSAPLKVTRLADLHEVLGTETWLRPLPLTETILSPLNLWATGGLLVLIPLSLALLAPRHAADCRSMDGDLDGPADEASPDASRPTLPDRIENGPWLTVALVGLMLVWAWRYYFPSTGSSGITRLTPDSVNLSMLALGLALHRTPRAYLRAVERAVRGCAGIILLFPLYAGIMGVMRASGMSEWLATVLAEGMGPRTLPLGTFFSAAVVNLFVPSGGGQWAVQGPIAMEAARELGADPARVVMALAYGDQLTNMLQPFWALPLLAITGVKARDIVGYTALVMVAAAIWILAVLYWA